MPTTYPKYIEPAPDDDQCDDCTPAKLFEGFETFMFLKEIPHARIGYHQRDAEKPSDPWRALIQSPEPVNRQRPESIVMPVIISTNRTVKPDVLPAYQVPPGDERLSPYWSAMDRKRLAEEQADRRRRMLSTVLIAITLLEVLAASLILRG